MESEIVRVISLSTTEISEITRLQIQSSASGYLSSFPNDKFYTLPNRNSLQTTISNSTYMAESF